MKKTYEMIIKLARAGQMPWGPYGTFLLLEGMMFPAAQILLSMAQKNLVNALEYGEPGLMRRVYVLTALVLILAVPVNSLAGYYRNKSVSIWTRNLRARLMDKLLRLPLSFFDRSQTGDVLARLNADLDVAAGLFSWSLLRLMLAVFYGVGSIIVLCCLNRFMAAVMIVAAVVQVCIMNRLSQKTGRLSAFIQNQTGLGGALFLGIAQSLRLIRMYSISHILYGRYKKVNQEILENTVARNTRILFINAVNDLCVAVNLLGVLTLGLVLYFNGRADLGSVMAFLILQDGVSYMLSNLAEFFPSMHSAAAGATRLFTLLAEPEEPDAQTGGAAPATLSAPCDIYCENIGFAYPGCETAAVTSLTARFAAGRITVIAGASGSGKTTLARLLAGLYTVETGHIFYGAYDGAALPPETVRASVAYVPQSPHLFYDTVAANISSEFAGGNTALSAKTAAYTDVLSSAQAAAAHSFIMEKPEGYQHLVRERGENFSGGQKQRIAIARAMYKNAPVIIWDEATSAVDAENEDLLHTWLRSQADAGKTVIVVAHRAAGLAIADTVIAL